MLQVFVSAHVAKTEKNDVPLERNVAMYLLQWARVFVCPFH
jgi:hypothetical protein